MHRATVSAAGATTRPAGHAPSHLRRVIAVARRRRRGSRPAPPAPAPLGERLADAVAATVGSWRFVLIQSGLLAAWIVGNAAAGGAAWDPYPFILLNLLLSFQAAYTAPIIMMSQNRTAALDRERAMADYEVNLRAEASVLALHDKLDGLRDAELRDMAALLRDALRRVEALERAAATPGGAATRG